MQRHTDSEYIEYNTIRQWAKRGFLPIEGEQGVELWANCNYQDKFIYYSPEQVAPASKEQLNNFFRPERERRNAKAKQKREKKKVEKLAELERKQQDIINEAIKPYLARISELQSIIKTISTYNAPADNAGKTIIIDTETTGLYPEKNELLQVSIIDYSGETLFDSYFKPCAASWKEAERVNHITPETVKNAPGISEKIAEINEILSQADVIIGYNTNFDIDFLRSNGAILSASVEIVDVMEIFAEIYGDYNEYFGNDKWQQLTTAANYYDYDWNSRPEGAHNSLADCYATLFVFKKIREGEKEI